MNETEIMGKVYESKSEFYRNYGFTPNSILISHFLLEKLECSRKLKFAFTESATHCMDMEIYELLKDEDTIKACLL